jgi:hypothetical protein
MKAHYRHVFLNSRLYSILLVVAMTLGCALGAEDSPASAETERAVRQLFEIVTKPVPPKLHIVARIEITSSSWSREQVQQMLAIQDNVMKDIDRNLRPQQ